MGIVITQYVRIEIYEVPDGIAKAGDKAIDRYLFAQRIKPTERKIRNWEVVEIQLTDPNKERRLENGYLLH